MRVKAGGYAFRGGKAGKAHTKAKQSSHSHCERFSPLLFFAAAVQHLHHHHHRVRGGGSTFPLPPPPRNQFLLAHGTISIRPEAARSPRPLFPSHRNRSICLSLVWLLQGREAERAD